MAKFWTIRTGKQGERTQWALNKSLIGGGWQVLPDLTGINDKEALRKIVEEVIGGSKNVVGNYTGQLWAMTNTIQPGDFMVLSIRATSQIAIGEVTKSYHYLSDQEDPNQRHVLGVKWLKTDIPKTAIKQDLLYQMGSALTVSRLETMTLVIDLSKCFLLVKTLEPEQRLAGNQQPHKVRKKLILNTQAVRSH